MKEKKDERCCNYLEYGINIISINWIINNIVEPEVIKFCCQHNLMIRHNSRDIKRIIAHFLATSVITTCKQFVNLRNIINLTPIKLEQLGDDMNEVVDNIIIRFLRKFKFCNVAYTNSINSLNIDQLYHLKALADTCHVKTKNLESLKTYLTNNNFTKLHQDINTDLVLKQLLT